MKRHAFALLIAAALNAHAATDPAREVAPAGGWGAGTVGGSAAAAEHVVTVRNRAELLAALERMGSTSKIVKVSGTIDMSEGRPFSDTGDQAKRSRVEVPSNTTLIGIGQNAGFVNATIALNKVSQVIIRNLHVRNPCDLNPKWDPKDGAKGNWNSLFDGMVVNASTYVWIDHNSFTDAPVTDDLAPVENGMPKQCHDGALDVANGSDLVTLSYNHFAEHEKNTLIGGSDRATGDEGKLRVTLAHNLFEHVHERAPRVRFGRVHVYNNYYVGARERKVYEHSYSIGAGKEAKIISHHNAFDVTGATRCADMVRMPATTSPSGAFLDAGSLLNGAPLTGCELSTQVGWSVPYAFTPLAAAAVKEHVLARAGAGKLASGAFALGGAAPGADYHVQARVKVDPTAGQAYVVARYLDADNWYGAGIDVAGGKGRLKLDVVRMHQGVLTRLKQVPRAMAADERQHTLRFVVNGPVYTLYLNGERITTGIDHSLTQGGQYGSYRSDDASTISDLRHGSALERVPRVALALAGPVVRAQAGDAPRSLPVSAVGADGRPLPFQAVSSDPAVAAVQVTDGQLVLTPRKAGNARITLAASSDAATDTVLIAQVAETFKAPSAPVKLAGAVQPIGAAPVPPDTQLRITFDAAPTLGAQGAVRIYRAADRRLIDTIPVGEDYDAIGYPGQTMRRAVRRHAITIDGRSVTIRPHSARLAPATAYYVEVSEGAIAGMLHGQPFKGIGKASAWRFQTRAALPAKTAFSVDDDGPADFRTVQGALNHVMENVAKATPASIAIRNGSYDELLYLRGKDQLTIRGESRDGVLLHGLNNDGLNPGTGSSQAPRTPGASGGRALFMIEAADLVTLDSLTIKNDTVRAKVEGRQAEALLYNDEAGRLIVRNASFFSEQDTIQVKGYSWFYQTLIAGNVDFIWGNNRVALFEDSELRTVGDSANPSSGGYLVQARTLGPDDKGFVFWKSRFTHGPGPAGNGVPPGSTYLARSPGTPNTWDQVSFIDCRMDVHIAPIGWAGKGVHREPAPNPAVPNAARGWREFGTRDLAGHPLDLSKRAGGYLMTADEAAQQFGSRAIIFKAFNNGQGWDPR